MDIVIVDYGMGNLSSVLNSFEFLGASAKISKNPGDLEQASKIVLPGVGAFGDGMKNLKNMGWLPALEREARVKQKPFLGICLGMQLLAEKSFEFGAFEGLGWIKGTVELLPAFEPDVRIPHIGWNDVSFLKKDVLYKDMGDFDAFYFVHSYAFRPEDSDVVSGVCEHGDKFVASIEKNNIFATQFHPEKSQKTGLRILKNFLKVST
jgi:glutamine amidotransferase